MENIFVRFVHRVVGAAGLGLFSLVQKGVDAGWSLGRSAALKSVLKDHLLEQSLVGDQVGWHWGAAGTSHRLEHDLRGAWDGPHSHPGLRARSDPITGDFSSHILGRGFGDAGDPSVFQGGYFLAALGAVGTPILPSSNHFTHNTSRRKLVERVGFLRGALGLAVLLLAKFLVKLLLLPVEGKLAGKSHPGPAPLFPGRPAPAEIQILVHYHRLNFDLARVLLDKVGLGGGEFAVFALGVEIVKNLLALVGLGVFWFSRLNLDNRRLLFESTGVQEGLARSAGASELTKWSTWTT